MFIVLKHWRALCYVLISTMTYLNGVNKDLRKLKVKKLAPLPSVWLCCVSFSTVPDRDEPSNFEITEIFSVCNRVKHRSSTSNYGKPVCWLRFATSVCQLLRSKCVRASLNPRWKHAHMKNQTLIYEARENGRMYRQAIAIRRPCVGKTGSEAKGRGK